ncbi:MAG: two-component regulator propeller domain-containing protein [Chitinophagaceae bacterium]
MLNRLQTYLICVCMLMPFIMQAQYYNLAFRNYSSANGLSQSEVNCVYRDRLGFIWIGTEFGLTRYDGREFSTYYHKVNDSTSLGENSIKDITEDNDGAIWLAIGASGVSRMEMLTKKFVNYRPNKEGTSVLSDNATSILADGANRVWVGLSDGVSVYENAKRRFFNLRTFPGTKDTLSVNGLQLDGNGRVWLASGTGLYFSDGGLGSLRRIKSNQVLKNVNAVQFDKQGVGWMATDHGLYSFNLVTKDSIAFSKPTFLSTDEKLHDIEFDAKSNLWISSLTRGLRIYFPKSGYIDQLKEDFSSSRGLTSNRIHDLYFDGNGGMWVSGENGVQSFHDDAQRFNTYPGLTATAERIRGSTMYGVFARKDLIILATSGGVTVFNRRSGTYLPLEENHNLRGQSIRFREVNEEAPGRWWITSDAGIFELLERNGKYILQRPQQIRIQSVLNTDVRSYLIHKDTLWMATSNDGLIRYNLRTHGFHQFKNEESNPLSLPSDITYKVIRDDASNIIVSHDMGVSILHSTGKAFESFGTQGKLGSRLSNRQVFDVYDDGNRIWLATIGGGLNIIDKKTRTVKALTTEHGLCNDAIYKMVPFRDSLIYLGTNKGLSVVNMRSLNFQNFDINDGMPGEEFNMYAGYVTETDEVFMGTTGGLISFLTRNLKKNTLPLGIFLSKMRKNGVYQEDSLTSQINKTRVITTKYGEDIFLEFSPLVFYTSAQTKLNYKIRELGEDWLNGEAGGLLPLVKMEPGLYNIDVRMVNDNGLRNSSVMSLKLNVLPPFWKTLWFRLLSGAVLLLVMYFAIMSYINRRLERQRVEFMKQQAVEQERARISAELHDDIGGGLTAIRLLSEMSLEHSRNSDSSKYLERISSSSNDIIQKMNEIVWALNNNNDNLQSLVAYTRQYTVGYLDDLNIDYHFNTPDQIPDIAVLGKNRRNVFLLVKEALNNIAKHANANSVDVDISIDDELHIRIHDDGVGFHESMIVPGNGLGNMRKRVQSLKGEMVILNGMGTTIKFDIPVKNLYA